MNLENRKLGKPIKNRTKPRIALEEAERQDVSILAGFLHELFLLEQDFEPQIDSQTHALRLAIDNPGIVRIYKIMLDNSACDGFKCAESNENIDKEMYSESNEDTGGNIIGMIALHKSISTAEGGWAGRIEDLYLQPKYRGIGIGAEVINMVVRIAEAEGLRRITLIADNNNEPALNFYKKHGFKEMNLVSFIMKL